MGIDSEAMAESMLEYVLAQLQKCKGQWPTVAEDTDISKRTLEKIALGAVPGGIADPGVTKIEKLAEYFRRREAEGNPLRQSGPNTASATGA
jgi:hypothetical protein